MSCLGLKIEPNATLLQHTAIDARCTSHIHNTSFKLCRGTSGSVFTGRTLAPWQMPFGVQIALFIIAPHKLPKQRDAEAMHLMLLAVIV